MSTNQSTYINIINNLTTVSEAEKQLLLRTFKKMEKERVRSEFKLMRVQKDKTIASNILNATIKDLERNQNKLVAVNNLLSEQKALVEENSKKIEESLHKLERSYQELEEFSYIASHDLKSPLRTISSFAQLLKRRYYNKLDKDANEFIEFIVSGIQQMNDVIRNSLEYAQVGKNESVYAQTDLNTVFNLVKLNLKEDIESSKAKVCVPKNLPSILGNKTSMLQLFQNLVSNAIKFRSDKKPIIKITFERIDELFWEFRISDNGIGMDMAYAKKAFMPFKRLNGHSREGQGIGLAICKKIVVDHKGSIHFESVLNQGTTFIFTLPIYIEDFVLS